MFFQEQTNSIIPSVIYSGLLSAFITGMIAIVSIYLQNKASDRRQTQLVEEQTKQHKERLDHESNQKRLDREMTLRRDIYLAGAESLGKMQKYILSFVDWEITRKEQNDILDGVIESLNKVALVASFEVLEELNKLHAHYVSSITVLTEKKLELSFLNLEKNNVESELEILLTSKNQQIELLKIYENRNDATQFNEIITITNEITNQINIKQLRIRELEGKISGLLSDLLKLGTFASTAFEKLSGKINLKVRKELGFTIDEKKYIQLLEESEKTILEVPKWFDKLLEKHKS